TVVQEWLNWVLDPISAKNIDSFSFQLEAYKLKYEYLDRKEALKELESFSLLNSSSEEAKVATSIFLDTLLLSQDWNQLYNITQKLLTKKNWIDPKFVDKIQELSSDTHLKITLSSTDSTEILTRTKECIRQFKNQKIVLQCKLIQAKTLVGLKQFNESEHELNEIGKLNLKEEDLKTVTLMKAEVHQKQGKLNQAAQELERFSEMTGYQDVEMVKHIIQIYWFQRNIKKLQPILSNNS
ncbi:MAG: hypothetical protein WCH62_09160, partial [Candidatus Omnitrophota bacterium]